MAMDYTHHVIVSPAVHRGQLTLDPATAAMLAPLREESRSLADAVELLRPACLGARPLARLRLRSLIHSGALAVSSSPVRHWTLGGVHLLTRLRGHDSDIATTVQSEYFVEHLDLNSAHTLVDVGAHIGSFSAYLKRLKPELKAIAVEAHPLNHEMTRLNVGTLPGAHVYHAACGYTGGDLVFTRVLDNTGGNTIIPRAHAQDVLERHKQQAVAVEVNDCVPGFVTLEQIIAEHNLDEISVLKLDCEGFEFDILGKASMEALRKIRRIVGERHSTREEFMQRCGNRLAPLFDYTVNTDLSPDMGLFLLVNRHPSTTTSRMTIPMISSAVPRMMATSHEGQHVIVSPAVHRGQLKLDPGTAAAVAAFREASQPLAQTIESLRQASRWFPYAPGLKLKKLVAQGAVSLSSFPVRHIVTEGVHLLVRNEGNDEPISRTVQEEYFVERLELTHASTVIDVGSHIGSFSAFMKHLQPRLRILAVEAHPENAEMTQLNLGTLPDVTVLNAACGYTHGDMVFLRVPDNSGGNTLIPRSEAASRVAYWTERGIRVSIDNWAPPFLTIEQLIAQMGAAEISVLKLDCEGYEFDILRHISQAALSKIRYIVGERHSTFRTFIDDCSRRLAPWFELVDNTDLGADIGIFLLANRRLAVGGRLTAAA